jgi:hypothetical protein
VLTVIEAPNSGRKAESITGAKGRTLMRESTVHQVSKGSQPSIGALVPAFIRSDPEFVRELGLPRAKLFALDVMGGVFGNTGHRLSAKAVNPGVPLSKIRDNRHVVPQPVFWYPDLCDGGSH